MITVITKPRQGIKVNRAHPLAQGLVGYWILNEGSGTRVNDISGYNRHGSANNFSSSAWTGSPLGGCLNFDATNDEIFVSAFYAGPQMSISAWVNSNDFSQLKCIADRRNNGGPGGGVASESFFLLTTATGNILWGLSTTGISNDVQVTGNTSMVTSKWYHIVCTYDGITSRVYLNGNADGSTAGTGSIFNNQRAIRFGSDFDTAGRFWNGTIDEIRIYSRALSPAEVQMLYASPHADLMLPKYLVRPYAGIKFNNSGIRPRPFAPGLAR